MAAIARFDRSAGILPGCRLGSARPMSGQGADIWMPGLK